MPRGTTFYDRDQSVTCVECRWEGIVAEARHGAQRPGTPHYCECPECQGAIERI